MDQRPKYQAGLDAVVGKEGVILKIGIAYGGMVAQLSSPVYQTTGMGESYIFWYTVNVAISRYYVYDSKTVT